jgi:hypothetical protein
MPADENVIPSESTLGRRPRESALQLGPRKKAYVRSPSRFSLAVTGRLTLILIDVAASLIR